jgi:hypothetical protein
MGRITESWGADWAWGLPLIVFTVIFHALGLQFIKRREDRAKGHIWQSPTLSIGIATLYITLLHAFEVVFWALAFLFLAAVPDSRTAMLYSLNALTSFGHADIQLERRWQLLGAMEALNGWILFGLSTAYLFMLIQLVWSRDSAGRRVGIKPEDSPKDFSPRT